MISKILFLVTLLYYLAMSLIYLSYPFFLIVNLVTLTALILLGLLHYLTIKSHLTGIGVIAVVMTLIVIYYGLFWFIAVPILLIAWIVVDATTGKKRPLIQGRYFNPQTNKRVFLYIGMLNEQEYARRRNPLAPYVANAPEFKADDVKFD